MNKSRIAIITDSGTDTPAEFCREHDVRVVPLHINYSDGTSYRSGVDITTAEVIDRFEQETPKTSLPSPQEIEDAYRKAQGDGYAAAVFVTIAAGLSATNMTAQLVANGMTDFPVVVIDSKSIGVVAGMVTMAAAKLAEEGASLRDIRAKLELLAKRTNVFFTVQELDHLYKGGRISAAVYKLGSMLNVKPVIKCDEAGHYVVAKKCRGWNRALDGLVSLAKTEADKYSRVRLAICCSDRVKIFDQMEAKLREKIPNVVEFVYSGVSADLIVHTGPALVGVGVQPME